MTPATGEVAKSVLSDGTWSLAAKSTLTDEQLFYETLRAGKYVGSSGDQSFFFFNEDDYVAVISTRSLEVVRRFTANGTSEIVIDAVSATLLHHGSRNAAGNDLTSLDVLWKLDSATVCAARDGQVLMAVNGQLVLLDARTGEQVTYTSAYGGRCPAIHGKVGVGRDVLFRALP